MRFVEHQVLFLLMFLFISSFLDQLDLIEIIMYLTSVIVFDEFKIKQSELFAFFFIIVNTIIQYFS